MAEDMNAASLQALLEESGASWSAGETSVSELTDYEKELRLGYTPGPGELSLAEREEVAQAQLAAHAEGFGAIGAPVAFDLRNVGGRNFITSVKDQLSCGSCVAFGTAATVEGTLRMERNNANLAIDLSEAHLFYCHARAQGRTCAGNSGGWWVPPALDCFKSPGVSDEPCYPYVPGDQNCTNLCSNWTTRVTKITSWRRMTSPTEMKTWLSTKGPLSACFTVYADFYLYRSGIYQHVSGEFKGGHCICVVGYDDSQQYWICKNSWGTNWGESGFFRIRYGDVGIDAEMWGVEGVTTPTTGVTRVQLYRYWNPAVADHFYTTNWAELGNGRYGWNYEGIQCYVFSGQQAGTTALYRYWNPVIGDHFYTTNWGELGGGRYGWRYEGIQCYVRAAAQTGTVPLYRYWNASNGDHFYTTNWAELGSGRYGWRYEGIQCYVYQSASGAQSEADAGGDISGAGEESIPDSFVMEGGGSGDTIPGSFAVASGEQDSGKAPASFATEDDKPASSFQIEEKKGQRVVITITTGDGN